MRPLVLLALLLAFSPALPAQTEAGDEEKRDTPKGRRAWFVATAIPEDLANPITVMTGKDLKEVTLSKRLASEAVPVAADGVIRVVRPAGPGATAPGEPAFINIAQATVPESVAQALIILIPAPPEDAPIVFRTRVQDLSRFRGGDTLYMNLTKANVAVKVGETNIPPKPGAVHVHNAPRSNDPVNTPVSYHFFQPKDEQWKLLSASTVVQYPSRREICIFSWDPRYNRIDYHGITFPVAP